MVDSFPFYSIGSEGEVPRLYHTHPRCRIAQNIGLEARALGTGEGRRECPFCFLLSQFQINRALRGSTLLGLSSDAATRGIMNSLRANLRK